METAIYRSSPSYCRLGSAVHIVDSYLQPHSSAGDRQFSEDNMVRCVPKSSDPVEWSQFISIPAEGKAPNTEINALSVFGEPVASVISVLRESGALDHTGSKSSGQYQDAVSTAEKQVRENEAKKRKKKSKATCAFEPEPDLFDTVDEIVFAFLHAKYFERFQESIFYTQYHGFMCLSDTSLTEDDFSLFRVLGRGGFGLVNGCKKCTSGKLFAMKVMDKRRIKMKKSETLCVNERNILAMVDSPFIVNLKYAFSTKTELFLILDLMTGGDLGFLLHRLGRLQIDHSR